MTEYRNISIRVIGSPDASSGYQKAGIYIYNSPQFFISDEMYNGMADNSYFFVVQIEPNEVVYQLVKNKVYSYGVAREARLKIGISIPKGYKLSGNVSPYDVLIKLKDTWLTRCMICNDTISETYTYSRPVIETNILDDIASTFMLVPDSGSYRPMNIGANNVGIVVVNNDDQIRQLLNDVQYNAFGNFSEVLVAKAIRPECTYTKIQGIDIPRQPQYTVQDSKGRSKIVNNVYEPIRWSGNEDDTCYTNQTINFTIIELIDGKHIEGVSINTMEETVFVDLKTLSKPRTKKVYIDVEPKNAARYVNAMDFTIHYNGIKLDINNDLSFTLTGKQIIDINNPNLFIVNYRGVNTYLYKEHKYDGNKFCITLVENRFDSRSSRGASNSRHTQSEMVTALSEHTEFTISVPLELLKDGDNRSLKEFTARIYSSSYNEGDKPKSIINDAMCKSNDSYEYTLGISNNWLKNGIVLKLSMGETNLISKTVNSKSKKTIDSFSRDRGGNSRKKNNWIRIILWMIVGILLGASIGAGIAYYINKSTDITIICPHSECTEKINLKELDSHFSKEHPEEPNYMCDHDGCNYKANSVTELVNHQIEEHQKCPICGENISIANYHPKCYKKITVTKTTSPASDIVSKKDRGGSATTTTNNNNNNKKWGETIQ